MKQIFQNLKAGGVSSKDLPNPQVRTGFLLMQTRRTLILVATERMLVDFG